MSTFPDYAQLANIGFIEDLYKRYLSNPESVDPSWRHFFEGIDFGAFLAKRGPGPSSDGRIYDLIRAYRLYGHLQARINPLGGKQGQAAELNLEKLGFSSSDMDKLFPTFGLCGKKEASLKEIIASLQSIYCGFIGFECTGLNNPELEIWIQQRIESASQSLLSKEEKRLLLEYLVKSEIFETFLQTKYTGQTRFSVEGCETLIPLLVELFDRGSALGIEDFFLGTTHRGRLNILANILNKPMSAILHEFEDDTALSVFGNNDVRYHLGFTGQWKQAKIQMPANPSHLESVDPVVLGQTFANQILTKNGDKKRAAAVMLHGDASIAGLGVVYESLQLMRLPSYSVGGTIHIVINNQIGYTTSPEEGRSTRYCTDIAKAFGCPVLHVNAESPESCVRAAKLAAEIRQQFGTDVFIDLTCYRKYGHNEGDEPSFTQPLQYQEIRAKKTICGLYREELIGSGEIDSQTADAMEARYKAVMEQAQLQPAEKKAEGKREAVDLFAPVATAVPAKELRSVLEVFCKVPASFHLSPKLQKWLSSRLASIDSQIDWSTGECLAFGSLLSQGVQIRLAGEDSERGTFSQRHMVWFDAETEETYCPFAQYPTRVDIVNSPLTEYAGMGFEYGYSWEAPQALVLWEAQYGDFNNGAQTIIDQYLVCGEHKWGRISSLVLLLPHGFEGAGPEHSSARLERFLQLAADQNIQVVNATTPAQYFHLLRRQALRKVKKPLILFTPKSLLRAPACVSPIGACTQGQFEELLDDPTNPASVKRLIFCSGKVFYDLAAARKRTDIAIVRIEQLYPLHTEKLKGLIAKYKGFTECFWVQEEPENMGAWKYIKESLPNPVYVGRKSSAEVATGSNRKHKQEQQTLIEKALT